jgi:DNA replication and repair protein RecF
VRLAWLTLAGFRSHPDLRFEPDEGVNVLVGPNGSGKTSLLEAIGYLVTLSSFRRSPDASLVSQGIDSAVIRGSFIGSRTSVTVEVELSPDRRRRVLVNGKSTQSRADIAQSVALVAFLPDDLDLIKRGPALRREFLDDGAAQLWPAAASDQRDYERALRQRNALLRAHGREADPTTLDVWDDRVSRLGGSVLARRLSVIDAIAPLVSSVYRDLGADDEEIAWDYVSAGLGSLEVPGEAPDLAARLLEAMGGARRADMERRTTTVGPHRDEVVIGIGDRDARTRASQGEQRSVALAMRVAVHRVLSERRAEGPILLLDDVFSELDPDRSDRLVGQLPAGQVFVTSARSEEVPLMGKRWTVGHGRVVPA